METCIRSFAIQTLIVCTAAFWSYSSSNPGVQQACPNDWREHFMDIGSQNPTGFDHRQYARVRRRARRICELRLPTFLPPAPPKLRGC